MARKFVSPGVFTTEIDQSFLAQGVANIGAAVIGLTTKGPAFAPTVVTDFNDFAAKFGDVSPTLVAPYASKNYLKNSSTETVVRVLGSRDGRSGITNGSTVTPLAIVGSGSQFLAEVHVLSGTSFSMSGSGLTFAFTFSGTAGVFASSTYSGSASFNSAASTYIGSVFNTDPTKASQYGHYLYKLFAWAGSGSAPYTSASLSGATTASFDYDYTVANSPWIQSQDFGGTTYNLFRFFTIGAGSDANIEVKVSIANIKSSPYPSVTPYGTFDVVVRAFSDTDLRVSQIETFTNLTLDPSSSNYVARVIGDQYVTWNSTTRKNIVQGTYKNGSKYVRISLAGGNVPQTALPWGHGGYPENVTASGTVVDVPYVLDNIDAQGNVLLSTYWGIDFSQDGIEDRLKAGGNPASVPSVAGQVFSLSHLSASTTGSTSYTSYNTGTSGTVPSTTAQQGFTVAFYGGWDGWDLTATDPLAVGISSPSSVAAISLKLAVDALSNPDEVDLNLLAIPGITDAGVNAYARQMCNDRADCMLIMDIVNSASTGSVAAAISTVNGLAIDDNYAATYYPCLRYSDTTNNVLVTVPPSVAVLGAYAYSDRVGQVFFAPAGLNRGGLAQFGIVDTVDRLNFQDRNDLYDARINPIATFPNEGIVVFGQKTLQARPSALDRVNVRRLLIYAKKTVASVAKFLLFEPNNPATWQRFLNTVNPILEKVRQNQGIERFKVVMDSTVNTPDLIDRNIMTGKIFLQPTRAAEFIDLSFIITASGVAFEE